MVLYWPLVLGSLALFFASLLHLFWGERKFSHNKFFVFILFLALVSVIFDYIFHRGTSLFNVLIIFVFAASVYRGPVKYFLPILNFVFFVSVVWSIISYHIGINRWGYIPGQYGFEYHGGMGWRIGLFPYLSPPSSGMFSLVVFFCNFFSNSRFRFFFLLISLYFLLFSGVRTVFVALVFGLFFAVFVFRRRQRSTFAIICFLVICFLLLFFSNYPHLIYPVVEWNDTISSMLLRAGVSGGADIESDARSIMFREFFSIGMETWPYGIGSGNIGSVYSGPGGSEMKAIRIFAESGILGVFFIVAALMLGLVKGLGSFLFFTVFCFSFLFYSSFIAPYNFVFLSMLALFSINFSAEDLLSLSYD